MTFTATGLDAYYKIGNPAGGDNVVPLTVVPVNIITAPSTWTDKSGPGTTTGNDDAGTLSIAASGGTPTIVRRLFTVVAGKQYRFRWTTSGTTCASALGTTLGGEQYKGLGTAHDPLGANTFSFQATATSLYIQFQRTNAGTCVVGSMILEAIT